MPDALELVVTSVVKEGNCSGCGVCTLVSPRIALSMDEASGFLRPQVATADEAGAGGADAEAHAFRIACPGRRVEAPARTAHWDRDLGPYVSVWAGWAADPDVRFRASSGGVLTALTQWLLSAGVVTAVAASGEDRTRPTRTIPLRVSEPSSAVAACGSRYAPVSNVSRLNPGSAEALVGKPCEIAGLRALERERELPPTLALAMFCAGTPSQHATDALIQQCGVAGEDAAGVRYRGHGWPGRFVVTAKDGSSASVPYQKAWGEVLGRQIDDRCRICVDGTGVWADIAVGDLWESDERGYPKFSEAAGRCAVVARTPRGHDILIQAVQAGAVYLEEIAVGEVVRAQPAQVARTRSLLGRLIARRLLGRVIPDYRGFPILSSGLLHPVVSSKYFVGTILRLRRGA